MVEKFLPMRDKYLLPSYHGTRIATRAMCYPVNAQR